MKVSLISEKKGKNYKYINRFSERGEAYAHVNEENGSHVIAVFLSLCGND